MIFQAQNTTEETRQQIPMELTVLMLLLILIHFSTLLMNQPPAYWLDPQYATPKASFGFLLSGGPWFFIGIALFYLIVIWGLLRKLPARLGLLLAAVLSLPHTVGLFETIYCGWQPVHAAHSAMACSVYSQGSIITFYILFSLILLGSRLPVWLRTWGRRLISPLAVGLVLFMGYGLFRVALPPSSDWRPLAPKHHPGPRTNTMIAYDTQRQRAVMFGGIQEWNGNTWVYDNSTWEWDGQDWIEINTPISPTGRVMHAMAYDEKRGTIVMYGGKNNSGDLADLWEYDGSNWRRLCPVCNPAARFGHKMFYDPELEMVVMYGGQTGGVGYTEAWTWDGFAWNYLTIDTSSPGMFNAPLIHIPEQHRSISFMPGDYGGTWVWENKAWSKLDLSLQPSLRNEAVLVYGPLQDISVLFGGTVDYDIFFNDTWVLQEDAWSPLTIARAPRPRARAAAFYDPIRQSVIVYGGEANGQIFADMWEFKFSGETNP
ncbi:MAG: hypothetical protein HY864_04350 [Chloroflexi bacterium]|nr:hypothetical protein [Chloroflexota bacterium]